ncbi:MAG: hypothetical protein IKZ46_10815 [Victivallales bacterium]|nr:hypothetical protein [Victivallales bacterium]
MSNATKSSLIKKCLIGLLVFVIVNFLCLKLFNYGLKQYYCLWPADILVIGHSMSEMAIDRDLLEERTGHSVAKYCMNGTSIPDRLVMIRHYIESTGHKPKAILYDIGPRSFSGGLAVNSHALFYPFINESPAVADYVRSSATKREYYLKMLVPLSRYDDSRIGAVIRGYRHDWKNRSVKKLNLEELKQNIEKNNYWKTTQNPERQKLFEETLDFLEEQDIHVFLLHLPNVDLLNNAEKDKNMVVINYIKSITANHPNVTFIDANSAFESRYELFIDPLHLNPKGQQEVTTFLADKISLPKQP